MAVSLPTLKLADLQQGNPITDKEGRPADVLLRTINGNSRATEAVIEALTLSLNRVRRLLSHTEPTSILSAADAGSSITVTVLAHTRVYADGTTQEIAQSVHPGKLSETVYAVYYDDETLSNPAPTMVFTTDLSTAAANKGPGRHFCGMVLTPPTGSGTTIVTGGNAPPGAPGVGGEIGGDFDGGGVLMP